MNSGAGILKLKKRIGNKAMTSPPYTNAWVAKTGFSLIFLSKHINETHTAVQSITKNLPEVRNTLCSSCIEYYKLVRTILTRNTMSGPVEGIVV